MSAPPASVLGALLLAIGGCAGGEPPAYTRLEGDAPAEVRARPGATLVVFWATWCPPCLEETPSLLTLARDPPARLSVLTVGEDEDEQPVREFFRGAPPAELGFRLDEESAVASAFGVEVLPAAFLVVEGRLVARFSGPRDWGSRAMRKLLARLTTEAQASSPHSTRPHR